MAGVERPPVVLASGGERIEVDRRVFAALFHNSVWAERAGVRKALDGATLEFKAFLDLCRRAEIPYPLFFAPLEIVEAQLRLKDEKLMAGFTKMTFSMNSRGLVELRDIELIVKDLLRKQEWLRRFDETLVRNPLVGMLKRSRGTVADDARRVGDTIGFDRAAFRAQKGKAEALEHLIGALERSQVFVSRSTQLHMPERMPSAAFSGLTIKDNKVPFIFLAGDEDGVHLEPAGRRVFTLALLTMLIAQGIFAPVTYDGHTDDPDAPRPFDLTGELLMPRAELVQMTFDDLDTVKTAADLFKVTPSAVVVRARRLGRIDHNEYAAFLGELQAEFAQAGKQHRRGPNDLTALRRYNGTECSRRMLQLLDAGHINRTEFRRVVLLNKIPANKIDQFREAVR